MATSLEGFRSLVEKRFNAVKETPQITRHPIAPKRTTLPQRLESDQWAPRGQAEVKQFYSPRSHQHLL